MKRSIIATILAATLLISMVGMVSAHDTFGISVDPALQNISVGATGTYTVTITVPGDGVDKNHTILFDTYNDSLSANITGEGVDTGALTKTASGIWKPTVAGQYNFTYTVKPLNNTTTNMIYGMLLKDSYESEWAGCEPSTMVVAGVNPTPELSTIAFVGIGLIGLVALGRRRT